MFGLPSFPESNKCRLARGTDNRHCLRESEGSATGVAKQCGLSDIKAGRGGKDDCHLNALALCPKPSRHRPLTEDAI